jgi:hypothetical protein
MKSPTLLANKNENKVKLDFQLENKIKIFVLSEAVYVRTHAKTKLELSGMTF